ncbi:hypothetical protein [Hyphomicrobium sp.]|uniref:hypothetical protein n=1 Tax=Hyphomicrobium sp. TaxID=82 RepID=UPI002FDE5EB8
MLTGRIVRGILIAAFLSPSAIHSASITNRDDADHTVTIIEGSSQEQHVLKPGEALGGICEKGCLIRLDGNKDDPFELQGSDVTSIEDGQLYDDGPEVPSELGSDPTDRTPDVQPSQPGPRP